MIVWIALGVIVALVLLFIFLPVVAWILVGLVLLILAVVLLVPIGADVGYIGGEFRLAARVDGFALQLLPKKPADPNKPKKEKKPKKPKKEKPPKEPKPEEETKPKKKRKLNFTKEELFELVKKAINGLGKFGKLTVRRFMLHYTAAGADPYNTAMTFGYVNWALSTLAPICAKDFRVTGDVDVRTDVDFTTDKMSVDFELSVTLRLIQVVHMALAVAFGALSVLIKNKLRLRREAKLAKKSADAEQAPEEQSETTADTEIEITTDERKDEHGE